MSTTTEFPKLPEMPMVKLPARVFGVTGVYANALYVAGSQKNCLDKVLNHIIALEYLKFPTLFLALAILTKKFTTKVEADLKGFIKFLNEDKEFKAFVMNSSIPNKKKALALKDSLTVSSPLTSEFLGEQIFHNLNGKLLNLQVLAQ